MLVSDTSSVGFQWLDKLINRRLDAVCLKCLCYNQVLLNSEKFWFLVVASLFGCGYVEGLNLGRIFVPFGDENSKWRGIQITTKLGWQCLFWKLMRFSHSPKKTAQKVLGVLSWFLDGEREKSSALCPYFSRAMRVDCYASLSPAWRDLRKIYPSENSLYLEKWMWWTLRMNEAIQIEAECLILRMCPVSFWAYVYITDFLYASYTDNIFNHCSVFPGRWWKGHDNNWTQHGRKELLYKASCIDHCHGTDWFLRSCRGVNNWCCGWYFYQVIFQNFPYVYENFTTAWGVWVCVYQNIILFFR